MRRKSGRKEKMTYQCPYLKIGHRGACGYYDENTLQSIKYGLYLGCQMIDINVHQCKSGDIIVIHDDTTTRTTHRYGNIKDMTLEEIRELRTTSGYQIPTLKDVLNVIYPHTILNIEIKDPSSIDNVIKIIRDHQSPVKTRNFLDFENTRENIMDFLRNDKIIITSEDYEILEVVRRKNPRFKVGWIRHTLKDDVSGVVYLLKELGCQLLIVKYDQVNKKIIDDLHLKNIYVFVFPVNSKNDVSLMKSIFVDGIISDYPDHL